MCSGRVWFGEGRGGGPRLEVNFRPTHLLAPLGVSVQEELVRKELLSDAAHVVELVAGHDQGLALVAVLYGLDPFGHARIVAGDAQGLGVDADGQVDDVHVAVLELHALVGRLDAKQTAARLQEVSAVLLGLEADQIAAEHALE